MADDEIVAISKFRRVVYTAFANFPVTGLTAGDLGYATDRLVLYRWNGAAWQPTTFHSSYGAIADIPTAADLPNGSIYYATDTLVLSQVQTGAWADITSASIARDANVTDFQRYPGQGDIANPEYINDNNTATDSYGNVVGKYGIFDYGSVMRIKRWRMFGQTGRNGDGRFTIHYWDLVTRAWVLWLTDTAPRGTADWSALATLDEVLTDKVKITITALDTVDNRTYINELEVIY